MLLFFVEYSGVNKKYCYLRYLYFKLLFLLGIKKKCYNSKFIGMFTV